MGGWTPGNVLNGGVLRQDSDDSCLLGEFGAPRSKNCSMENHSGSMCAQVPSSFVLALFCWVSVTEHGSFFPQQALPNH